MNKIPRKLIWLAAILLLLVWFSPLLVRGEDAPRVVPNSPITLEVGIQGNTTVTGGITDYIQKIYYFATAIVGGLAVVMIIIGAVQYSTSAGNKAALGSAKETITSAIIGLIIVLMAYLILGTFSGSFVNLANPRMNTINVNSTATTGEQLVCQPDASSPTGGRCVLTAGQGLPQCSNVNDDCQVKQFHFECQGRAANDPAENKCVQVAGPGADQCKDENSTTCAQCRASGQICSWPNSTGSLPCCNHLACCDDGSFRIQSSCKTSCEKCDMSWSREECEKHAACKYTTNGMGEPVCWQK